MSLSPNPQPMTPSGTGSAGSGHGYARPTPTSNRLNFAGSPSAASAARNSIINSSAKGWSPLQINKRDSTSLSPLKPSPNLSTGSPEPGSLSDGGPRRTSNSFKHVTKNSLVSKSPFKSPTTLQGRQAAGLEVDLSGKDKVVHEKKQPRALGQSPEKASGVSSTPKAAIGLGISATSAKRSSSGSRTPSGAGASVSGARKVSMEKVRVSLERRGSGSKENNSPDARYDPGGGGKKTPRSSMGWKGLAKNELVTKSPFLSSSKRVPSAEFNHGNMDGISPKTVPVEQDDVFSSPSPRRNSGRKSSPSPNSASRRTSDTPPRGLSSSSAAATGPSPLGKILPTSDPTPTTPRSAMTPSRRLRGPRDLADLAAALGDSPSKQPKTVTFQSVPDVKEFEPMSIEGSADGSFDVDEVEEAYEEGATSLDDILESSIDGDMAQLVITNPDAGHDESSTADFVNTLIEEGLFSPPQTSTPAFEDHTGFDESFEMPLEEDDHLPSQPPTLSTPSLGSSIHVSPMFNLDTLSQPLSISTSETLSTRPEVDSAGIPYGRTHHIERNAIAHSKPNPPAGLTQPALPPNQDHHMMMNATAQPSTYSSPYTTPFDAPLAHQYGPIADPFITVQTAKPSHESTGDSTPGRSHADRIAARTLATQSLGLGMPRSPAISRDLTNVQLKDGSVGDLVKQQRQVSEDIDANNRDKEALLDIRYGERAEGRLAEGEQKRQSRAPAPQQLDLPEPVASPRLEEDRDKLAVKSFALPFIGTTSPFFSQTAQVEDPIAVPEPEPEPEPEPAHAAAPIQENSDRPLTPPPSRSAGNKTESPHRIPSLDLGDMSMETIATMASTAAGVTATTSTRVTQTSTSTSVTSLSSPLRNTSLTSPTRSLGTPNRMSAPPTTSSSSFTSPTRHSMISSTSTSSKLSTSDSTASKGDFGTDSTTTKVRQRISREMIKETIQQRIADGSITRRGSTQALMNHENVSSTATQRPVSMGPTVSTSSGAPKSQLDKALPMPPSSLASHPSGLKEKMEVRFKDQLESTDMMRSKTDTGRQVSDRPTRQRAMTTSGQSAHEALKASEREGMLAEPKSALDRIIEKQALPAPLDLPTTPVKGKARTASSSKGPMSILKAALHLHHPSEELNASTRSTSSTDSEPLLPPQIATQRPASPARQTQVQAAPVHQAQVALPGMSSMDSRENAIIAKRREKDGLGAGARRKPRRSLSTGDVEDGEKKKDFRKSINGHTLTLGIDEDAVSMLDAFQEEAANIGADRGYKVRERPKVHASYGQVGHGRSGDINGGKAWRSLRRPSDMNEHAAEIRAMRTREANAGKASGTIFVKVLGIESLAIPLPEQQTFFCVTLDNGIDYIRTPYSPLMDGARVNQEFSLVEHPNFEFSLSLDIRRDPHILKAVHEQMNPTATSLAPSVAPSTKSTSGFRGLFGSPRKPRGARDKDASSIRSSTPIPPPPAPTPRETIAKYLAAPNSSTVAKTHVAFKPIAKNCEAKVLEIRYPMFAMFKGDGTEMVNFSETSVNSGARRQVAKVTLQIFRLPPLEGLKPEEMPACIDDCLRGMRYHQWHECEYHEGVLTQQGGDCKNPKRRVFKLIGGNLVAINEVTKKTVSSIDLRKATRIVDLSDIPPAQDDEEDEYTGFEGPRSFRIVFTNGDRIDFESGKKDDKAMWVETLQGLVGKIPANPLWAEVLARKQREKVAKRSASRESLRAKRSASGIGAEPERSRSAATERSDRRSVATAEA